MILSSTGAPLGAKGYWPNCFSETTTDSTPSPDVRATFYIGGSSRPGGGWIGGIDEVAIYDHVLNADQVTRHYRAGRGSD